MSEIIIKNLTKYFGKNHIIKDVSLKIKDKSFTVMVGPSGCGKSTILRMIAGLEATSVGEISIGGEIVNNLPPKDRNIAMVFQSYALYPHMSVFDNMAFGLKLEKLPKQKIRERVLEVAKILQIEDYLTRKPKQLSGGQRQRVAIGRAITRKPKVFLFDEPLSNLDAALRIQMRVELAKLHRQLGATMVYVTHDQTEAMTMADEIIVLDDGKISQIGQPMDLYHKPENMFVAGFIGSPKMNFVECTVKEVWIDKVELELSIGLTVILERSGGTLKKNQKLRLGIRPQDLHLKNTPQNKDGWISKVVVVEKLGSGSFLYLEENGNTIVVETKDNRDVRVGEKVNVKFDTKKCHLFDQENQLVGLPP